MTVAGLASNNHGNFLLPKTGVYTITDPCSTRSVFTEVGSSHARCDMDRGNGGWLVIQRRVAGGTEDFFREWSDYEEGFGDLEGEFWYGLKNIHCLTNRESVELRLDLEDEDGNKLTSTYQEFRVEGPKNKYRLHIGGAYSLDGSNDLMFHTNNMYFSTKDRDNDVFQGNCAKDVHHGAWWYAGCALSNPNGVHNATASINHRIYARPRSYSGSGSVYFPNYEMKIRSKSCPLF